MPYTPRRHRNPDIHPITLIGIIGLVCLVALLKTVSSTPASAQTIEDGYILAALYSATDGANWSDNSNWLSDKPIAEWYGVTVNDGGGVISLILSDNRLSGEIPSELGNLANLTELYLSDNRLSGDIPSELGKLTNLTWLSLNSNQLNGEIPSELGKLTNLTWLRLGSNQLNGEIPSELGKLTNLTLLDLSDNRLSGDIPSELGKLTNLTLLALIGNQLNGEIPSELGKLTNLTLLDLSFNQLSGEIPPELGNLANLDSLNLGRNQLSGEIPLELGNLANLDSLLLGSNQLSGCIPEGLRDVRDASYGSLPIVFCDDTPAPPSPTNTPEPTLTPSPTHTSEPTATPSPTSVPEPTLTPSPTHTSELTLTPKSDPTHATTAPQGLVSQVSSEQQIPDGINSHDGILHKVLTHDREGSIEDRNCKLDVPRGAVNIDSYVGINLEAVPESEDPFPVDKETYTVDDELCKVSLVDSTGSDITDYKLLQPADICIRVPETFPSAPSRVIMLVAGADPGVQHVTPSVRTVSPDGHLDLCSELSDLPRTVTAAFKIEPNGFLASIRHQIVALVDNVKDNRLLVDVITSVVGGLIVALIISSGFLAWSRHQIAASVDCVNDNRFLVGVITSVVGGLIGSLIIWVVINQL